MSSVNFTKFFCFTRWEEEPGAARLDEEELESVLGGDGGHVLGQEGRPGPQVPTLRPPLPRHRVASSATHHTHQASARRYVDLSEFNLSGYLATISMKDGKFQRTGQLPDGKAASEDRAVSRGLGNFQRTGQVPEDRAASRG